LYVHNKKELSVQVKKQTTHQDPNHVFILGTPVYMVANTAAASVFFYAKYTKKHMKMFSPHH
jgi:hypothetical protein